MFFKLRNDNSINSAMDVMEHNLQYQEEPLVGIFWYDVKNNELFGVQSTPAQDVPWYNSPQFGCQVKTDRRLHQNVWKKEFFRKRDDRFFGDYTKVPRGRIFQFKDSGFKVFTGDWIKDYPQCKELIVEEFQLPVEAEFVIDEHWDLGHEWSDDFI